MASVVHDYQPNFAGPVPAKGTLGCAANIRIPGGTIVTVDSDGRADVPTAGQNAVGIALATFDNRTTAPEGGAADAINVEVLYGVFELNYTGTAPKQGETLYVVDNVTVSTDSSSATRGIAGQCTAQHTTGKCDVWVGPYVLGNLLTVGTKVAYKSFDYTDVAALGAVASGSIDFDAALPAGAVVVGGGINVTAIFDNAGDTASVVADLGIASGDTDAFCDGMSLDAVAKVGSPAGVGMGTLVGAVTPSILVDPDVNCDTITKGAAVAYVLYVEAF